MKIKFILLVLFITLLIPFSMAEVPYVTLGTGDTDGVYLNLSGTNANQNIDIGDYNLSIGESLNLGDGNINFSTGNVFRFNHGVYIEGTNGFLDVDSKLLVGGYAEIGKYLTVEEYLNITGELNAFNNSNFNGSLMPMTTLTWDVGSGAYRWRVGYFENISVDYLDATHGITTSSLTASSINATIMNITTINAFSMNVTTINASYIYNPYFAGYMDMRGDPWYLGGTDLEIAENLIVGGNISGYNISASNNLFAGNNIVAVGNISGDWINGKFNWTSADDWNIFDGSILDFNDTKLSSIYYNATASSLILGTIDGGTLVDTQHNDADYDGKTLNFSEASGSPALDLRVNFTGVTNFSRGVMRYKTSNLAGDYPVRQLWNYDTSTWETLAFFVTSEEFVVVTQPIFNNVNYVQDGLVQMRIYKADNGKINNHYYIDWVAMVGGYGVPSGQEIDPYSFHMSENLDNTGYNITADWGFFNYLNTTNITSIGWCNSTDCYSLADFLLDTGGTDTQKTTNGFYLYNDSSIIYFNETMLNVTIDARASGLGGNASWNESYADTLYSAIGTGGNASWNESYAYSLYAPNTTSGIQHLLNATGIYSTYNATYDALVSGARLFKTNGSVIYNETTAGLGLGTSNVVNMLDVEGGVAIRSSMYDDTIAPTNGLFVEGSIFVGGVGGLGELDLYEASPNDLSTIRLSNADGGSGATDGFLLAYANSVTNYTKFWGYEASPMIFGTNNLESFRINVTGDINMSRGRDICIEGGNCLSNNWTNITLNTYNSTWDNRALIGSVNTTSNIQELLNGTSMNFSMITAINITASDSILSNFIGSVASRVSKMWVDDADITFINNTNLNTTGDIFLNNDTVLTRSDSNKEIGISEKNGPIVINLA